MYWKRLPKGTRVRVVQRIHQTDPSYNAETTGVIESWGGEPTGAWYAHGRNGKLWLERLRVRKADGEIRVVVIDDQTRIHPIEAATE